MSARDAESRGRATRGALVIVLEHDRLVLPSLPAAAASVLAGSHDVSLDDTRGGVTRVEAALRAHGVAAPSGIVLVVGLSMLELAEPELPPLDDAACTGLLTRDADRYFPLTEAVAVQWRAPFAIAAPDARLQRWITALATLAPVDACVSIVDVALHAAAAGALPLPVRAEPTVIALDAGAGERGALHVVRTRDGVELCDVRRTSDEAVAGPDAPTVALPAAALVRSARALAHGALDTMLLPRAAAQQLRGRRRRRWGTSAALLAAALVVVAWAADHSRERTLAAAETAVAEAEQASAPARAAAARLAATRGELATLASVGEAPEPGAVLARLGQLLPRDAFIERLEWDGGQWRIDGSAAAAPAIVPRLDADSAFTDVRIVAASTRFTDNGRQRESFSIAFRARGLAR